MKFICALCILFSSQVAFAQEAPEPIPGPTAASSSAFQWSQLLDKVNASYAGLLLGPSLRKLDGDTLGKGNYTSLRNYLSLGYSIDRNWRAESGWEVRQTWRPKDPKNPNRKDFEMRDPYLGLSRRNVLAFDNFTMGAKARFFLPVSENTKSKIGKAEDAGNGEINAGISPSWKFLDGDLLVGCATDVYIKIPERAPTVREDFTIRAKPLVSYQIARKFAAKVEYQTGYLRHTSNGKWSKFNDKSTGQKIYLGVSWFPTKQLTLSPAVNWGSDTFRLNRGEASLFASYAFL